MCKVYCFIQHCLFFLTVLQLKSAVLFIISISIFIFIMEIVIVVILIAEVLFKQFLILTAVNGLNIASKEA